MQFLGFFLCRSRAACCWRKTVARNSGAEINVISLLSGRHHELRCIFCLSHSRKIEGKFNKQFFCFDGVESTDNFHTPDELFLIKKNNFNNFPLITERSENWN